MFGRRKSPLGIWRPEMHWRTTSKWFVLPISLCITICLFMAGCSRFFDFSLKDAVRGVFSYSGEAVPVDSVVVTEVNTALEDEFISKLHEPGTPAVTREDRNWPYRIVWLVTTKKEQFKGNYEVQYGTVPRGFFQMLPKDRRAPKLTEGRTYDIEAGWFMPRYLDDGVWLGAPGYIISMRFTIKDGMFVVGAHSSGAHK